VRFKTTYLKTIVVVVVVRKCFLHSYRLRGGGGAGNSTFSKSHSSGRFATRCPTGTYGVRVEILKRFCFDVFLTFAPRSSNVYSAKVVVRVVFCPLKKKHFFSIYLVSFTANRRRMCKSTAFPRRTFALLVFSRPASRRTI